MVSSKNVFDLLDEMRRQGWETRYKDVRKSQEKKRWHKLNKRKHSQSMKRSKNVRKNMRNLARFNKQGRGKMESKSQKVIKYAELWEDNGYITDFNQRSDSIVELLGIKNNIQRVSLDSQNGIARRKIILKTPIKSDRILSQADYTDDHKNMYFDVNLAYFNNYKVILSVPALDDNSIGGFVIIDNGV